MQDVSYDVFTGAFLSKITEYDLLLIDDSTKTAIVDGYMKRAISAFKQTCKVDFILSENDGERLFVFGDLPEGCDFDEIVDIVSEGMVVNWLKPYVNKQENLELVLNTKDYTTYSPAELLHRVGTTYQNVQSDFTQMMREYSFNHGDLTTLHI